MKDLNKLIDKVSEISKRFEEVAKVSGNNFNVFNVINVTTDEVRLHSKFLAELLNPNGSHGQEDVFLRLFVDQFKIDIDTATTKVEIENYIGTKTETTGGYLDIYAEDAKGKSFIIENKIYAKDQENQLLRYYNYMPNNLLYLTLLGNEPHKNSYGTLKVNQDFMLLSYKEDIISWLTACRKEAVELPLLREGITHYINLIKNLTGQSTNSKMNKEITKYIASSADNLKQATLIEQNLVEAKILIQWNFWNSLEAKLVHKNLILLEKKKPTKDNIIGYYTKTRNRDYYYGFWIKIYEKENITIYFGIEIAEEIYYGFTIENNGKGGISSLNEYGKYRNIVLDLDPKYKNTEWFLGSKSPEEKLNFSSFNSDAIFNLADSIKLDETTTNIANDIHKDIIAFKLKLKDI
ncbi:PD-(D/E)XK nuclease family protein [Cellulophaga baltica]|uniref:PDDEXK-like family protein n=1 Tax=Cellulophaga baltica TaxID=76594 RepID=UPI0024957340|nr:PD-(D/E)XK nuclease family protein [Cellulophaga baltica]